EPRLAEPRGQEIVCVAVVHRDADVAEAGGLFVHVSAAIEVRGARRRRTRFERTATEDRCHRSEACLSHRRVPPKNRRCSSSHPSEAHRTPVEQCRPSQRTSVRGRRHPPIWMLWRRITPSGWPETARTETVITTELQAGSCPSIMPILNVTGEETIISDVI